MRISKYVRLCDICGTLGKLVKKKNIVEKDRQRRVPHQWIQITEKPKYRKKNITTRS